MSGKYAFWIALTQFESMRQGRAELCILEPTLVFHRLPWMVPSSCVRPQISMHQRVHPSFKYWQFECLLIKHFFILKQN